MQAYAEGFGILRNKDSKDCPMTSGST